MKTTVEVSIMDNYIFRSALNGFNRQDVTAYIEKAQKEAADRVAELESQLETLRQSEEDLRGALENSRRECDDLREQLAAQASENDQVKKELEAQMQNMRDEVATAHKEKENVAQLELEARKRADEMMAEKRAQADEIIAQARSQAQALLTTANEQSEDIVNQANQSAEEIRCDMEGRVRDTCGMVDELASSVETIVSHVSAELRKMDVAAAQLPISFNHLRDGMKKVLEFAGESVEVKK